MCYCCGKPSMKMWNCKTHNCGIVKRLVINRGSGIGERDKHKMQVIFREVKLFCDTTMADTWTYDFLNPIEL